MAEVKQGRAEGKKVQVQALLEVQNISKRFPGVVALDDVSLQFMPGLSTAA